MVDLAEVAGDVAARDHAPDVPREQRGLLGGTGQPLRAAQVQDGAVLVEQHLPKASAAGEEGKRGGVDATALLGPRKSVIP